MKQNIRPMEESQRKKIRKSLVRTMQLKSQDGEFPLGISFEIGQTIPGEDVLVEINYLIGKKPFSDVIRFSDAATARRGAMKQAVMNLESFARQYSANALFFYAPEIQDFQEECVVGVSPFSRSRYKPLKDLVGTGAPIQAFYS